MQWIGFVSRSHPYSYQAKFTIHSVYSVSLKQKEILIQKNSAVLQLGPESLSASNVWEIVNIPAKTSESPKTPGSENGPIVTTCIRKFSGDFSAFSDSTFHGMR